jgi:NDP-sugar pyrophosphorylase family protein
MQIAKNKDQVAKIILNYRKENNQKLDDNSVNDIISSVRNVDAIANIIIDLLGYYLSEFNIEDLLEFTNNKQKTVKSILKYVPKEKINAIIERFGIETKLIPESRSVRNFRKTIRQLIKENHKQ